MTDRELKAILRGWVAQAMGWDAAAVRNWKGPKAHSPHAQTPYAMVELTARRSLGSTPYRKTTNTPDPNDPDPNPPSSQKFVRVIQREKVATCRVRIYGPDAMGLVEDLQDSVLLEASKVLFRAAGIGVVDRSEVMDLTYLQDTTHAPHAQVDFHVSWRRERTELTPIIETMNAPSTLTAAGS